MPSFVDPSSLRLASPAPSSSSASSPGASTSSSPTAQPSRKRARTSELTSEEKREARAERNRLAAQCSRDRRKAQYSQLEKRVAELEAENALLRAGGAVSPIQIVNQEQERENQELRERVKMLEKAWDNVAKVLQSLNGTSVSLESLASTPVTIPPTVVPATPSIVSANALPSSPNAFDESTRHLAAGGLFGLLCSPLSTDGNLADFGIPPTTPTVIPNNSNNTLHSITDDETESWLRAVLEPAAMVSESEFDNTASAADSSSSSGAQSPLSTTSIETTSSPSVLTPSAFEEGPEQMEMDELLSTLLPTSENAALGLGAGDNQWPWTWGVDPLAVPSSAGSSIGVF